MAEYHKMFPFFLLHFYMPNTYDNGFYGLFTTIHDALTTKLSQQRNTRPERPSFTNTGETEQTDLWQHESARIAGEISPNLIIISFRAIDFSLFRRSKLRSSEPASEPASKLI